MTQTVRVGAVQAEPVWLDLQGGVEKTIALIQQAGKDGVNVLGFPEVWLPGYPWAIWSKSVFENTGLIHSYMANSMARVSPEMDRIRAAAKKAKVFVVLGYSERDGASLYIAQSFINTEGEIVLHRRKIRPTHVERSVWGDGQADSLTSVVDTPFGKVGGLNCWEHLQPLLRYYEYCQGVQIHVSSWPPMFSQPDPEKMISPFHVTGTSSQLASRFLAIEGQTFVIIATQVLTVGNLEKLNLVGAEYCKDGGGGFTMIFGPDGTALCEPWPQGKEGIMQADINLNDIDYAKAMADPVGHYSRPDLLSLKVNTTAAKVCHDM